MTPTHPSHRTARFSMGLLVMYGLLLLGFVVVGLLSRVLGFDVGTLTRDPAQLSGRHPLVGALSNLGALTWCVAAAVCLFTWSVVRRGASPSGRAAFYLSSGLLSVLLLLDDLFLLHDDLLPQRLGIPENLVFALYGLAVVAYLRRYRLVILGTDWRLLVLALTLGALSVGLDVAEHFTVGGVPLQLPMHYLVEDGLKFTAIVTWAIYFWQVCAAELGGSPPTGPTPPAAPSSAPDP